MAAASPAPVHDRTGPSLADWLRGRTDDQLAVLLRRRPDLALPAPADLPTLATRLGVRTSVQRAVDGLDAFGLRVLEVLALSDAPVTREDVRSWVDSPDDAIDELLALVLVWGEDDLRVVPAVHDAIGPYPAGLGRPAAWLLRQASDLNLVPVLRSLGLPPTGQPRAGHAIAATLGDPARLTELLDGLAPDEREVVERLAAGPPIGRVRDARTSGDAPAQRLLARGLLVAIDAQTVELPREVALALRARPFGAVSREPTEIEIVERTPAELDRLATVTVLETVRLVDALAESWTKQPPAQLRSGGVGVRDLRRTARELGVDEANIALIAEVAAAAGLLNSTHSVTPVYLPTADYDLRRRHEPAQRWADLALAWLGMTRQPSLVGQRGDRDRVITALGPDAERGTLPALRRQVLGALAQLPPGSAPRSREAVLARLAWYAPRRAGSQRPLAAAILAEADLLGITAGGGLTGYSRTLLDGSRTVAEQVLAEAMPAPVDHLLVQPDLTVVVPGPPTPDLGAELALFADLESTGGASVYRITEASVRRALDAGRSGAAIAATIAERSRTPVPQALRYMIDDLARRHGQLRSGAASAYLRCDDEALLSRVVADRDTAELQLQRIAPTVVVSGAPVAQVLEVLRDAGYAPAAEDPNGSVITLGVEPARAPSRQPVRPARTAVPADSTPRLAELVSRIRSGDALTQLTPRTPSIAAQFPGVTSAATMGTLRDAIREGRRVLIGVAAPDGVASRHTILPISLGGGVVRGHEPGQSGLRAFALHRITAVTVLAEPDPDA